MNLFLLELATNYPGQIAKMTVQASGQPGQLFQATSLLPVSCSQRPVRKCGGRDVVNITIAEDCLKLYGVLVHMLSDFI